MLSDLFFFKPFNNFAKKLKFIYFYSCCIPNPSKKLSQYILMERDEIMETDRSLDAFKNFVLRSANSATGNSFSFISVYLPE